jgi:hypothetical protein
MSHGDLRSVLTLALRVCSTEGAKVGEVSVNSGASTVPR